MLNSQKIIFKDKFAIILNVNNLIHQILHTIIPRNEILLKCTL